MPVAMRARGANKSTIGFRLVDPLSHCLCRRARNRVHVSFCATVGVGATFVNTGGFQVDLTTQVPRAGLALWPAVCKCPGMHA